MRIKSGITIVFLLFILNVALAGKWPGHAILGNGRLCAAYSDDKMVTKSDGCKGVRHLYFDNFSADYLKSSSFEICDSVGDVISDSSSTLMLSFFTVGSSFFKGGKQLLTSSARAASFDGLIFQCSGYNRVTSWPVFKVVFNENPSSSEQIRLVEIKALKNGNLFVRWSNNVFFILFSNAAVDIYKKSNTVVEMRFPQAEVQRVEVFLLAGNDEKKLIERADSLSHTQGLWTESGRYWDSWISKGSLPYPVARDSVQHLYNEYYSRNIYASFCSNLNGQLPACISGQFLTNGLPQVYPRDALMVARALMESGYPASAASIIRFWTEKQVPLKSSGEFYVRYDAFGKAVDAGTGVRFDEPEWDAGAYLICLLHDYSLQYGTMLADTSLIFSLADFLSKSISANGLLYDGGITEWTGYHPSTNMLGAASLMSAAEIAAKYGRADLKEKYSGAWNTISESLPLLYDTIRHTYTTRRYWVDKSEGYFNFLRIKGRLYYQWDVTSMFGVLWGYPDHDLMRNSYDFIWEETSDRGGVRYFEAGEKDWLAAFGSDFFFFNTAAAAEYAVKQHLTARAASHINWMIANSNIYGLMPERILSDYSGCSETSPLTRSCAEFALAIKSFAKSR